MFKRLKETPRVNVRFVPAIWRHRESALLPYPAAVVWSLVHPAENATFLHSEYLKGWRVEGTPVGLGEQQAVEDIHGRVLVSEVIEYEPNRRAVARLISPELRATAKSITEVEPRGDAACVLAVIQEWILPPQSSLPPAAQEEIRGHAREYMRRVTEAIGPWAASQPPHFPPSDR